MPRGSASRKRRSLTSDDAASAEDDEVVARRRLTKNRVFASVGFLVLVGGGIGTYLAVSGNTSASALPISVTNENVTVTTATMEQTISASGTLEPTEDSDLTFEVSGTVDKVYVTTGDKVHKGQTLATIDSTALADDVSSAQATVTSDEDRLTTDEDDDASASTIDTDVAQVTSAKSQLSTAEIDLDDATLKATFSGTVASVDLSVGTAVTGGTGSGGSGATGSGSASSDATNSDTDDSDADSDASSDGITVISTGSFSLTTSVDDTEIGEVKVGDQVDITPSDSTTAVYGTVASVSLIASTTEDSSVASFPVTIDVTGSHSGIYAGDSATASIIVKEVQDAVEVPTAAISYSNGQATVTQVVGGSDKAVDVTTGITSDDETQITSGLSSGDVIVERVVKFNASGGSSRSILGSGSTGRSGFSGGTPPGGGFGGGDGFGGNGSSGGGDK